MKRYKQILIYMALTLTLVATSLLLKDRYDENQKSLAAVKQVIEFYRLKNGPLTSCRIITEKEVREMTLDGADVKLNSILLGQQVKLTRKNGQVELVEWDTPINRLLKEPELLKILEAFHLSEWDIPRESCEKWNEIL